MIILPDDMTREGTWDFAGIWAAPIAQTDLLWFIYIYNILYINIYIYNILLGGRPWFSALVFHSQFVYHIVAMDDILPPQQGETSWAETPLGLTWPRGKKTSSH